MIELRNIIYQNPTSSGDSRTILNDISFTVPEGSLACILGASGSGKTTLLRLMAGLVRPASGAILIDGRDITKMKEAELNDVRREMGFVFQYGALFDSLTVGENIGFALEQARWPQDKIDAVVKQLLAAVELGGIEEEMPDELSGGMKKRVAMARALAASPRLVFYDEPTSGLDPLMTRIIDDLMVSLRELAHATYVVVSHDVNSVLRIADDIILLHEGRIVEQGNAARFRNSKVVLARQFLGEKVA
ncbi:MAG: ATP-binding cassette domain-containing protein [Abditibacteriaceae bacterium]